MILNACCSSGEVESMKDEVKYVITIEKEVMDRDAGNFIRQFYESLGYEGSIEGAFSQARSVLELQSHELQPKLIRKDDVPKESILQGSRSPIMAKTSWWQRLLWFL
jgi:hypothetical protein